MKTFLLTTNSILVLIFLALLSGVEAARVAQTPVRVNGKIAFTSDRDGNREIYVMNANGTDQVRLTNNNIIDDNPTWSPDGRKIAFLSQNVSGAFAIFVMNSDGTGKTEITPVNYQPQFPVDARCSMSWSPDGQYIVFFEYVSNVGKLVVVNSDGSNRHNLTSGIHPAWSPDGSKILFLTDSLPFYLYTIRPDGTDLQNVTPSVPGTSVTTPPTWSPDGLKFAFSVFDGANQDIYIANANGSNAQYFVSECTNFVPSGCSGAAFPAWSPNGGTITFTNSGSQSGTEIYVKNIGGGASTRLTDTAGYNYKPNWQPLAKAISDFDGDGRSDISVFRPSDRNWYLNQSTAGFSSTQFGLSTDKIAPADYDGDGKTDIAVYRDGTWYLLRSTAGFTAVQFGQANDIPQPADFDGDERAELAVYRAGAWHIFNLLNNQSNTVQFGLAADKPVVGDYDGDGRADCAIYRDGIWYLNRSTQGLTSIQFGLSTDRLVPADYDGDGKTDAAVYRDGSWHVLGSQTGFTTFQFGLASDIPVPADYDGDGKTDAAVYRDGVWYLRQSTSGFAAQQFGLAGDLPIPSAYVR